MRLLCAAIERTCCPESQSHNIQVMSPDEVMIFSPEVPRKRQHER